MEFIFRMLIPTNGVGAVGTTECPTDMQRTNKHLESLFLFSTAPHVAVYEFIYLFLDTIQLLLAKRH